MSKQRLLIVINELGFFISHRLPIAIAAQNVGYSVHIAYGTIGNASEVDLRSKGFKLHHVPIKRGSTDPLTNIRYVFLLWKLFRYLRPDLVHLVTIKPILYGGIAAHLARVPAVMSAIAGLGFVFNERSYIKAALLRNIIKPLFRFAFSHSNQKLIFQNQNDRDRVLSMTSVSLSQTQLIRGSGIDLKTSPILPEPDGPPIVVMASRLLNDKGVKEFVAAARILVNRGLLARFWLIGEPDLANPTSISSYEVDAWKNEGVVECLGYCKNVQSFYAQSHVVTLPSYYGEGLPKSLIEAAACGRAVVTTDMPGCRDAIEPNVSGLLIPPRNELALADALQRLIVDAELRQSMGKAGRNLAEREFGIEKVVNLHLQIYRELLEA